MIRRVHRRQLVGRLDCPMLCANNATTRPRMTQLTRCLGRYNPINHADAAVAVFILSPFISLEDTQLLDFPDKFLRRGCIMAANSAAVLWQRINVVPFTSIHGKYRVASMVFQRLEIGCINVSGHIDTVKTRGVKKFNCRVAFSDC